MAPLLFHGRVSRASPRVGAPGSVILGGQLRRRSGLRADPGQGGASGRRTLCRAARRAGGRPLNMTPSFRRGQSSRTRGRQSSWAPLRARSAGRRAAWSFRRAGPRAQARVPRAWSGARCARCTERCAKRGPVRGPVGEPRRIVSERRARARTETETERSQLESRPCKACNGSARGVLSSPRSSPKPR